ncbi:hypothetical protein Hsar01_02774 [Haloferula sargassicola]|uniref:Uncharacterized protein n=1 Tax=Haloferula sargassicola TaxID=490096 RepID=A0ABP9UPP8_9BACT
MPAAPKDKISRSPGARSVKAMKTAGAMAELVLFLSKR